MAKLSFYPREILFAPLSRCNLSCAHCDIKQHQEILTVKTALKFLIQCARFGITRIGFTGGEPFLALDFITALSQEAVKQNMLFGRITTNGVCFKNKSELTHALRRLKDCGYDGDINLSVDAFHPQNIQKLALFITTACRIFNRPDIISIAAVKGVKDKETLAKLKTLAQTLKCPIYNKTLIKNKELILRLNYIPFCANEKTLAFAPLWGKQWFEDDRCLGPGNIFFVNPKGEVYPCCGYNNESQALRLGTIKNTPQQLTASAKNNGFVKAIFSRGLGSLRSALERKGVKFPGPTKYICFFCRYLSQQKLNLKINSGTFRYNGGKQEKGRYALKSF